MKDRHNNDIERVVYSVTESIHSLTCSSQQTSKHGRTQAVKWGVLPEVKWNSTHTTYMYCIPS